MRTETSEVSLILLFVYFFVLACPLNEKDMQGYLWLFSKREKQLHFLYVAQNRNKFVLYSSYLWRSQSFEKLQVLNCVHMFRLL